MMIEPPTTGKPQTVTQLLPFYDSASKGLATQLRAEPTNAHARAKRVRAHTKSDTKSGKRHHLSARLNWQQACDLGFRGNLEERERLLGAARRRD